MSDEIEESLKLEEKIRSYMSTGNLRDYVNFLEEKAFRIQRVIEERASSQQKWPTLLQAALDGMKEEIASLEAMLGDDER
jgi:phage terminase Nu1 subunit (DNA packaging protein)